MDLTIIEVVTVEKTTGENVSIVISPSIISSENSIPAIGALNVPAIPDAAPQAINTFTLRPDNLKSFPKNEPIAAPICTIGPTLPAEPPEPMNNPAVITFIHITRGRIIPPFNATDSITSGTPIPSTSFAYLYIKMPDINPPNIGINTVILFSSIEAFNRENLSFTQNKL